MRGDVRQAIRALWKDRAYGATVVLTLAVCLGANAAIFTIVRSVLLEPLPIPDSGRVLVMANRYPNAGTGAMGDNSAVPDYFDRLRDTTVYEEQAMYAPASLALEIGGSPELVRGMAATPSLFRLLKVPPLVGRAFDDREGEPGSEQVVVLAYGLWQQMYGGAPDVVGRTLRMSGRAFTVVGVMPRGFQFADPETRFWIPLAFTDQQKADESRHSNNWVHVGRLKPGATPAQAQSQVDAINAANLERFPQWREILVNAGFHTRVERLQDVLVRSVERTLYLLWGSATVVLLIGGLNIANLALARSALRARELATRVALGASRGRVARQLAVEGSIVAAAGGAAGLVAGLAILRALQRVGLEQLPRASEIQMDPAVAAAILGVALIAGVLIGLVPLSHLSGLDLGRRLREETRAGTGGRRTRSIRRVLVVAEVAFAFVLLLAAGLLVTSFRNLVAVDPGFQAEGVLTASLAIPRVRYPRDTDARTFTSRLLQAVGRVPGVTAAGATSLIPLGGSHSDSVILAEGYRMQPGESLVSPMRVMVTPGYFEAMGTPLVRGRYFDARDNEDALGVVIVDERLARRFWPGADPIGRRMYEPTNPDDPTAVGENTRWVTVVGVVREVQLEDLAGQTGSAGAYYHPAAQIVPRGFTLAMKTAPAAPEPVLAAVRTELQRLDPEIPLFDVRPMTEYTARSLMPRQAAMVLATSFGLVSVLLAAVGLYGVLAYLVGQRRREIGIRIALGSPSRSVVLLVLREGILLVAIGASLGCAGAFLLRGVLDSQLYGLSAMDPRVMAAAGLTLAGVALIACALPARRAAGVDPAATLSP